MELIDEFYERVSALVIDEGSKVGWKGGTASNRAFEAQLLARRIVLHVVKEWGLPQYSHASDALDNPRDAKMAVEIALMIRGERVVKNDERKTT